MFKVKLKRRLISRDFDKGRGNHKIKRIILHTYGGRGESLFSWFNKNDEVYSSAHYAILQNGKIEQYVLDSDTAWHAGTEDSERRPNNNFESIGVEHQDNGSPEDKIRTDALYKSSATLVAYLCITHDIPCRLLAKKNRWNRGIALHNYYANKDCPGGLDAERIVREANILMNDYNELERLRAEVADKDLEISNLNESLQQRLAGLEDCVKRHETLSLEISELSKKIKDLQTMEVDLSKHLLTKVIDFILRLIGQK